MTVKKNSKNEINMFIKDACKLTNNIVCEDNGLTTLEVLNKLRDTIKDPTDVENFISKHNNEILSTEKN